MIQFEYMQVAHPYGILLAHDLNAYGLQGWGLVNAEKEVSAMGAPTGLTIYTFMRAMPAIPRSPEIPPWAAEAVRDAARDQGADTHQHVARASRRDPVVESGESESPSREES